MVATPAESPRPDHPVRGRCLDGRVEGRRVTCRVRWLIRRLREDASDAPRIVDAARDPGQPFSAGGDAENLGRLVAGAGARNPGAGSRHLPSRRAATHAARWAEPRRRVRRQLNSGRDFRDRRPLAHRRESERRLGAVRRLSGRSLSLGSGDLPAGRPVRGPARRWVQCADASSRS